METNTTLRRTLRKYTDRTGSVRVVRVDDRVEVTKILRQFSTEEVVQTGLTRVHFRKIFRGVS